MLIPDFVCCPLQKKIKLEEEEEEEDDFDDECVWF